mgnify:CR=1 FL=1
MLTDFGFRLQKMSLCPGDYFLTRNFVLKKFRVKKFRVKKIWCEKNFVLKKFRVKKISC